MGVFLSAQRAEKCSELSSLHENRTGKSEKLLNETPEPFVLQSYGRTKRKGESVLKVAIVEDDEAAKQQLEQCLDQYDAEYHCGFEITWYPSGTVFLEQWNQNAEIVFMDVEMPGLNGVDTARKMRETAPDAVLMFVTNLAQYAIAGYEVNALDFVLKPVNYFSFKLKITRALEAAQKNHGSILQVNTDHGTEYIKATEVWYIEVQSHDLLYHTAHGVLKTSGALKKLEEKLQPEGFFRCNYCYLVNLRHVQYLHGNVVAVGSDELQVSRNRRKDFLVRMTQFYGTGGK